MNYSHMRSARLSVLILLFLPLSVFAQVSQRDTTLYFDHFAYTLDAYYSTTNVDASTIETDTFQGIVLENQWLTVTLVPEFGGRIVSMVYRPTGQEQLYTNPVGVPYLMGQGVFYHDWLMVYAGIFPTFPEPEHGKYWNVPWDYEIQPNGSSSITVSMWKQDTLHNPRRPGQYNNGVTGITCYFDVRLSENKPSVDIDVRLANDGTADNYEYWTCITFAPGSEPGNTATPSASEMVVPIADYQVGWNAGDWMYGIDEIVRNSGPRVQRYENLAHLSNWEEQGIAYAYPDMAEPYYGVINHENEAGLFRLSSDQAQTPGLKFWTWGDDQGLNADPMDFNTWARPYIELWSGTSQEFFEDAYLAANAEVSWTESYMPTLGMPGIDYIAEGLAFYHQYEEDGVLALYGFAPAKADAWEATVTLTKDEVAVWSGNHPFTANAVNSDQFRFDLVDASIAPGTYQVEIVLSDDEGIFHTVNSELTLDDVLGLGDPEVMELTVIQTSTDQLTLAFADALPKTIRLLNPTGAQVRQTQSYQQRVTLSGITAGLYIVQVQGEGGYAVQKVMVR